jgi:glycine/D-amino acid oxidase-like deaminating enzyme
MQSHYLTQTDHHGHEPSSYWQKTTAHVALSTDLPHVVDVAVVGGGILGIATGYWLARAGVAAVVLERITPAHGATGRNGGVVSISTAEPYPAAIARLGQQTAQHVLRLTLENQALLRQTLAEEEIACDYREPGHLSLALDADQFTDLARTVTALQADGVSATLIDRREVQELVGTPLGPEILGGKFLPKIGLVHSARLVHGLAQAAQRHGARMYAATVLQLSPHGGGVQIHTTHGSLHANTVVVAVNAWTGEILPMVAKLITPVRGQALAYAPTIPTFTVGMSANVTPTGEYWQQAIDGTIVLGGCRAVAPGYDVGVRVSQPTAEVQTALEGILPRLFPSLHGLQVVQRWAGLMAFTPDYLPIVDRVPSMPDVWVVGGFSGHGMPFGMRLSQLLAEAITGSQQPTDLGPFRLARATLSEST